MALTVVPESAGILMFVAVVLMIIAILCGSICVVHKLRKMAAKLRWTLKLRWMLKGLS